MLTLVNCEISGNSAAFGGGVDVSAGGLLIQNCQIHDNTASRGGGVDFSGANVTAAAITGTNNQASSLAGGGIYVGGNATGAICNVVLSNDVIRQNSAAAAGGGVAVGSRSPVNLLLQDNTIIWGNWVTGTDGMGGGLYFGNGTLTTKSASIIANSAAEGGGLYSELGTTWVEQGGAFIFFNTKDNVN